MSATNEENGLVTRATFDRLISSLQTLIATNAVELRFSRGGSFRAAVVTDRLQSTLKTVQLEKRQFEVALAEAFIYLNAVTFRFDTETILRQFAMSSGRFSRENINQNDLRDEINQRLALVRSNVKLEPIISRARFRMHSVVRTIDTVSWSVSHSDLLCPDDTTISLSSAGIMITLFEPSDGQIPQSVFPSSIFDFSSPQVRRISFAADETDIDGLINTLQKIKEGMSRARRSAK